jgi:hypothetical protein
MHSDEAYTIRPANDDDAWVLRLLAALDCQRQLARPVLIGEIDGVPAAAISLADGREAADPFRMTLALRELLRARASALRPHPTGLPSRRRKRVSGSPVARTSEA